MINDMKIALAGDHYTVKLIGGIENQLHDLGIQFINFGTQSESEKISLQSIIPAVVNHVLAGKADIGILACGTGVGVEIGANRFKGIRASLCRDVTQAKNARMYDNANALCLGAWYDDPFDDILSAWLNSEFDGSSKRQQMLKDFDMFG